MSYRWVMLLLAAAAMVGTLPGRTQGLGLITEPLLEDLGIGRVDYAQLNLWATLAGSLFAIGIGRFIDRLGARIVLTIVAAALGLVVCAMSSVHSFWALAIAVTLTRGFGQSALSVVSLVMVGQWFSQSPAGGGAKQNSLGEAEPKFRGAASPTVDTAMAVYSIVMSIGFMIAFPVVGSMVQSLGWRSAWLAIGVALLVVLAPISFVLARTAGGSEDPPLRRGESLDSPDREGATWQQALATPAFWVFSIGAALYGLVASGIGLFNESILKERGFGYDVYYQTLVVTAVTALIGNFGGGWSATRISLTNLLATSLFVLALGLAAMPHITAIGHVMAWATAMGLGGGLVMVLFFSVWPRVYGRAHLGRIQGAAQAMTVIASAVGPLLLAWCVEWTGSYAAMFNMLAAVIGALAFVSMVTPLPNHQITRSPDHQIRHST
ncbi:MAG: MFS transporter [Cyanobacteria bacterium]|nr:MFS transporter [Cyanobacteriota bacterium]